MAKPAAPGGTIAAVNKELENIKPMGRPCKYEVSYGEKAFNLLADDVKYYTENEIGPRLGINADTYYRWKRDIPHFYECIKTGLQMQEGMMARKLIRGDCNTTGTIFVMKNSAHRWKDRHEVDTNITVADAIATHEKDGDRVDWDTEGGVIEMQEKKNTSPPQYEAMKWDKEEYGGPEDNKEDLKPS